MPLLKVPGEDDDNVVLFPVKHEPLLPPWRKRTDVVTAHHLESRLIAISNQIAALRHELAELRVFLDDAG